MVNLTMLSTTQAEPERTVKLEQEQMSPNMYHLFLLLSTCLGTWIPSHIFVGASIHQFQLPLFSSSASSITINKECSLPASLLHPSNSTMELSNSFKSQSFRWRGVNKLSLSASMYACMGPSIHDVSNFFRIFGPPLPPYPHWATDQNCKSTQPLHFH